MKLFKRKKAVAVGLTAGLVLGLGGAAFSFWTTTGTGQGTASVGTDTQWVVAQTTNVGGPLTPGGPTETIGYTVTNNSTGHQKLNQVTIQVATTNNLDPNSTPGVYSFTNGTDPNCTKGDFNVGGAGAGTTAVQLPAVDLAPSGVYTGSVTVQMVNLATNQNSCKNQNPPLFYSAS
jgi:hypothetical protein